MGDYIFLGGGGFALELYGYVKEDGHNVIGYYALEESPELREYIPWLGSTDTINDTEINRDADYLLAVRLIKYRIKMIEFIEKNRLKAGSFIHSQVYKSVAANLGKGVVAFPRAMITGNVKVGDYLFIDGMSVISHGDVIGKNVVIGPAVTICGDCAIGDNVTFGVNSAVLPGTVIGSNSEIAINSYPAKRVSENSTIISLPGKNIGIQFNKNFQ